MELKQATQLVKSKLDDIDRSTPIPISRQVVLFAEFEKELRDAGLKIEWDSGRSAFVIFKHPETPVINELVVNLSGSIFREGVSETYEILA